MHSTKIFAEKTSPSLATKRLFCIFLVAGLVVIIYGYMTNSSSAATARPHVIFVGYSGPEDTTASQPLSGNYHVTWRTEDSCSYRAEFNGENLFSARGASSGTKNISLVAAAYRVHMMSSSATKCAWQVRFDPS